MLGPTSLLLPTAGKEGSKGDDGVAGEAGNSRPAAGGGFDGTAPVASKLEAGIEPAELKPLGLNGSYDAEIPLGALVAGNCALVDGPEAAKGS